MITPIYQLVSLSLELECAVIVLIVLVEAKKGIDARRVENLEEMLSQCDVVTIVSRPPPSLTLPPRRATRNVELTD